jgi:trehalose 6-phosphate phosphatase
MLNTETTFDLQRFFDELRWAHESALLLDYDGTLSPFRVERDEAFAYPGVSMLLTEIMRTGHTRVVLVTGRRAHEVIPLLGIDPHPEIWGAHGLQRLSPDGSCDMPHLDYIAIQALAEADAWIDGLTLHYLAEHKPGSLSVHWRGLPVGEQSDIRKIVSLGWMPVAHRACMVLQEFDGGMEIRIPDRNKGDAVRAILAELGPEAPVAYLGDDETDDDAFHALADRGLRVLVRPQWRESPVDVWLRPPAELLQFLGCWFQACRKAHRRQHATGLLYLCEAGDRLISKEE